MFVATLVASGSMGQGDIAEAADRLRDAGCAPSDCFWLDADKAADLFFGADPAAARAALAGVGAGIDIIVQATETREALLDWDHYLHKTYRKTAALICLACESCAVLGGHTPEVRAALSAYGRHLGLAYQIVDDMLDLSGSSTTLEGISLSSLRRLPRLASSTSRQT